MLYQLGESGSSSAISSETLIFSGTGVSDDSSPSRVSVLPSREYPNVSPASVISFWTPSRSLVHLPGMWLQARWPKRPGGSLRTPLERSSAL